MPYLFTRLCSIIIYIIDLIIAIIGIMTDMHIYITVLKLDSAKCVCGLKAKHTPNSLSYHGAMVCDVTVLDSLKT